MSESHQIDREKVNEAFNTFAKRHGNINAVLDVNPSPEVKHRNIFRDYISKRILTESLRPAGTDVVVDYGCGVGRLSRFLSPSVKRVVGLDTSTEMIRVAFETTKGFDNIDYHVISQKQLPVDSGSADKFFAFWVMQHMSDEEVLNALQEAKRMLRPGGRVFLFEQVKEQSTVYQGIHHMRTPEEYISLAQKTGLTFVSNHRVFRFPSYAMDVWQRFRWLPKAFLPVLGVIENATVNRKPETITYSTNALIFRKG